LVGLFPKKKKNQKRTIFPTIVTYYGLWSTDACRLGTFLDHVTQSVRGVGPRKKVGEGHSGD